MDLDHVREYVLDSAAILVQENGAQALDIEKIAAAGSVSVEEIRAVFPEIKCLLKAVMERMFHSMLDSVEEERGDDMEPGSWTRAYIRVGFPEEDDKAFADIAAAILHTVPYDPELISTVRENADVIRETMEQDQISTVNADIIRAAVDGVFMSRMFSLELFPVERSEAFRNALLKLTY